MNAGICENQIWKSQTINRNIDKFIKDLEVKNNALKVLEDNIKAYLYFPW